MMRQPHKAAFLSVGDPNREAKEKPGKPGFSDL